MTGRRGLRADSNYDVVIIGSGAGGASVAQRLAPTGKSILILERGDHLPVTLENWDPSAVFLKRRYRTTEKWRDRRGRRFHPLVHYHVGGNTSFYGCGLFRFRKSDFDETLHAGGVSPAWPISYADLKPYYDEAEALWRVRGVRGADPTCDAGAPPYAQPPIDHDPDIAILKTQFEGIGWRPFEMPLGIDRSDAAPWKTRCIRCTTCGGFPCMMRAKSDARTIVDQIDDLHNVALLTNAKVLRLETDASGRDVRHVVYEISGEEHRVRGDVVVLAAGAINSAAILLRSRSAAHPAGLANGSDQVGRNYMFHNSSAVISLTPSPVDARFPKTFAINDFYHRDPDGDFDYPMGNIQLLEYMNADVIRGQIGETIPRWLVPRTFAESLSKRIIAFLVMSEDLPDPRNRIRLNRRGEIVLDHRFNNLAGHNRLVAKLERTLWSLGRICGAVKQNRAQLDTLLPLYGTAHQCGTLRMGRDPKSSVVNPSCKAHELRNLYVADTSVYVSSAAVNPALTAIANALRVGDIIKERLA
ncbi:MAG: GMC oxidoreductase [Amphiplicatus sp.]